MRNRSVHTIALAAASLVGLGVSFQGEDVIANARRNIPKEPPKRRTPANMRPVHGIGRVYAPNGKREVARRLHQQERDARNRKGRAEKLGRIIPLSRRGRMYLRDLGA